MLIFPISLTDNVLSYFFFSLTLYYLVVCGMQHHLQVSAFPQALTAPSGML